MQITEIKDKIDQSRDRTVILNRPEDTHIEAKLDCGINTATERMYLPEKRDWTGQYMHSCYLVSTFRCQDVCLASYTKK